MRLEAGCGWRTHIPGSTKKRGGKKIACLFVFCVKGKAPGVANAKVRTSVSPDKARKDFGMQN